MSKEDVLKELATYLNLEYVADQSEVKLIGQYGVFTIIFGNDVFHISVDDIKGQGFNVFVECVLIYHGYVLTNTELSGNVHRIGDYMFFQPKVVLS